MMMMMIQRKSNHPKKVFEIQSRFPNVAWDQHYIIAWYQWVSPRYYTVNPKLLTFGNTFKAHEEFLSLHSLPGTVCSHVNMLTLFSRLGGR